MKLTYAKAPLSADLYNRNDIRGLRWPLAEIAGVRDGNRQSAARKFKKEIALGWQSGR